MNASRARWMSTGIRVAATALAAACLPAEAATYYWVGNPTSTEWSQNNWFNFGLWDPMILPGPGDSVVLPGRGSPHTRPVGLMGVASIMNFDWHDSPIGGGGALHVHGVAQLGSPFANTELRLEPRTTLNFHGGATLFRSLRVQGVLNNLPGSTFLVTTIDNSHGQIGGNGIFSNAGDVVVNVSGTPWQSAIGAQFDNSGTLTLQAGTFSLQGGGRQSGHFHIQSAGSLGLNTNHLYGGSAALEFLAGSSIRNDGVLLGTGGSIRLVGNDIAYSGDGAIMATGDSFTIRLSGTLTPREVRIRNDATLDLQSPVRATTFSFVKGRLAGALDVAGIATFGGESSFDRQTVAADAVLRLHGGAVQAGGTLVVDGTLRNEAGSRFVISGLPEFGSLSDGVIAGTGRFVNAGTVVHAADVRTRVYAGLDNGGDTVVETGTLGLLGGGTHSGRFAVGAGAALELGGNHRFESTSTFTNGGTLLVSGGVADFAGGSYAGSGAIRSTGGELRLSTVAPVSPISVEVAGGSIIIGSSVATPRAQVNAGKIEIQPGGVFSVGAGSVSLPFGGALVVNGRLEAGVLLVGGSLNGRGHIQGDVRNFAGLIAPAGAGELTIAGDFEQSEGWASTQFWLAGTVPGSEYSVLTVGGRATLNGTLRLTFADGFAPQLGDRFTILNYGTHTGAFAELMVTGLSSDYVVHLAYGERGLQIFIGSAVPEPAAWSLGLVGALGIGVVLRRRDGAARA